MPVIAVLTQCYIEERKNEFMSFIKNQQLKVSRINAVLAEKAEINGVIVKSFGLIELVNTVINTLPDAIRYSFISSQKVSLEVKVEEAQKYVSGYSKAAFITGFTPIPFSDAPILIAAQSSMLIRITNIFGMNIEKSVIAAIIGTVTGTAGTTAIGKKIFTVLVKRLPGGAVVGGTISGMTAYTMTMTLGNIYIKVLETLSICELKGKKNISELNINEIQSLIEPFVY